MIDNSKFFKKIFLLALFVLFFQADAVFAASTVNIVGFYNNSNANVCNLETTAGCENFTVTPTTGWIIPRDNRLVVGSTQYGGTYRDNLSVTTNYLSTYTESSLAVAMVPPNLQATSATYLCTGPTGTTMRSVPATGSGSATTFVPVDTTGMDCDVTINFNSQTPDPSDPGGGGGGGGGGNLYGCQANACVLDNTNGFSTDSSCGGICSTPSSISISVNPVSSTVNYADTPANQATRYFDVVVTKSGNFGANIIPGCEVFASVGSGGGSCSFVDGSNNPIARTMYGQPSASATYTLYPSYYMDTNVNSVTLKLAVRNYDEYGGKSSVKTHVIPVQAGLIEASGSTGTDLLCDGNCTDGATINFIVQNAVTCQATTGVSATSQPTCQNRNFNLAWNAVAGASSYTVEVRDQTSCVTPGCGPVVFGPTNIVGTSATIPFGGDIANIVNKRFGYTISTNYTPAIASCSNVGSVLVAQPINCGDTPPPPPGSSGTVNLTCNGSQNATISSGQNCNLAWTSTNTIADSCVASGNWSGAGKPTAGNQTVSNITQNSSFTLTCNVVGGGTASSTANVAVVSGPTANLTCNGSGECTAVRNISEPNLSWTCGNSVSGSVAPAGFSGINGSQSVGPFGSVGTQTYTLTCTSNTGATATDSVNINVVNAPMPGSPAYRVDSEPDPFYFVKPRTSGAWGGTMLVTNIGDQILNVNVSRNAGYSSWVNSPNPSSCPNLLWGGGPGSTCIINVSGITDPLSDGIHNASVEFTEASAGNQSVPVTLEITGPPTCSSGSVILSANTVNVGSTITASAPAGFTNCRYYSNSSAVASAVENPFPSFVSTVTGNSAGSTGIYAQFCTNNGVSCPLSATTINVNTGAPSPSTYSFSVSSALVFNTTENNLPSPATQSIRVTNTGNQTLNLTRSATLSSGGTTWGSAGPIGSLAPGAYVDVNVTITSTMLTGVYDGIVNFTDSGGNATPKTVPVTLNVTAGGSTRTVTVNDPNWCGTVTSDPVGISCGTTCTHAFTTGTDVELTATPKTQCVFVGWLGECAGQGAVCNINNITNNKSTTPVFGLKPFFYQEF